MNATKTIPIILVGSGRDPVRAGYVESFLDTVANDRLLFDFPHNIRCLLSSLNPTKVECRRWPSASTRQTLSGRLV
jgi:hypothetical protein